MPHEVSHYLEATGLRDTVHELLVGNVHNKRTGIFTAKDKNGKPIEIGEEGNARNPRRYKTNKEFEYFRTKYKNRLGVTEGVKDVIATDEGIASEIFAEHGADYMLYSPQKWASLYEGPISKVMRGMFENTPLLKNATFVKKALASRAVSYTHLTLPTILLV